MAIDLSRAVQQASYDALSAGVTLAPVYQHVPDDKRAPYVVIEGSTVTYLGGKDGGLERHDLSIMTVSREPGRLPVLALQAEVREALNGVPMTAAGADLSAPEIQSAADQLLDDGLTYVGSQRFTIFAQAAD